MKKYKTVEIDGNLVVVYLLELNFLGVLYSLLLLLVAIGGIIIYPLNQLLGYILIILALNLLIFKIYDLLSLKKLNHWKVVSWVSFNK